jgi:hypothetical protein
MIQTNIENTALLNGLLISNKLIEINSKIFHFVWPIPKNINNIPEFNPNKILSNSLKHTVYVLNPRLKENPIFFSLIKNKTFDLSFIEELEKKGLLEVDEIKRYKDNYYKSIDMITHLLSDNVNSLDFGKKFWDVDEFKV